MGHGSQSPQGGENRRGPALHALGVRGGLYAPIRTGTDIIFLGGVIKYLLDHDKIQHEYVRNYTDFSFIVREDFAFDAGLYSGYNAEKRSYDKSSWDYERGDDGYVKTDPTLEHPRCVYQLLKKHYSLHRGNGRARLRHAKDKFLKVCDMLASTATDRAATILYALGWTQHSIGSQIIRTGAMVQLLLGNIGIAGGDERAARALEHPGPDRSGPDVELLPGYMTRPTSPRAGLRQVHRRARLRRCVRTSSAIGRTTPSSTSA